MNILWLCFWSCGANIGDTREQCAAFQTVARALVIFYCDSNESSACLRWPHLYPRHALPTGRHHMIRGVRRSAIVNLLSDNYQDRLVSWLLINTRVNT